MSDFFKSIVDDLRDDDVHVMADGKGSAEFTSYIDTGCYMLNALISGSLFGGMADNKVLAVAGESSTGKTFFALGIVKQFLDKFPDGGVMYYDTESAITKDMMESRGVDSRRVIIGEPATIQDFRTKSLRFLEAYGKAKSRPPLLIVLDSLGMLSSVKEIEDTDQGKDTRDMTKAPLIKGLFRVLRLKLAKLHVPMVVIGHTYAAIGAYVPTQELSGGSGLKYSSDSILTIRKSKDKDGTEVVGVIVKGRMYKSRMSRENQEAAMRISYDKGLDRYYGLLEFAEEAGVVQRIGNKYVFPTIADKKFFKKEIMEDPERFWTDAMLRRLEPLIRAKFQYGVGEPLPPEDEDDGVSADDGTSDPIDALKAMAEVAHDPETGEILD